MKKTLTVNLAGQVFHIDEDACDVLSSYLGALNKMYSAEEGGDEIVADIEDRIAEIFVQKLKESGKTVISILDVNAVVKLLGKPEELEAESIDTNQSSGSTSKSSNSDEAKAEKRYFRNPDDTVIAGVCSGLSKYLGIDDPIWIRLIFVLLFFVGTGGLLIYVILWIIVPEAKTSAQKLQMKGEPVNLENIEKTFKSGFKNVEQNLGNLGNEDSAPNKILKGFGTVVLGLAKALIFILKWVLVFLLGALLFSAAISFFGLAISGFVAMPVLKTYLFDSNWVAYLSTLGGILFLIVTALYFVLLPFQIFSKNIRPFRKPVTYTLLVLWFTGMLLMLYGVMDGVRQFSTKQTTDQTTSISAVNVPDTLYINSNSLSEEEMQNTKISLGWGFKNFELNEDGSLLGQVKVNIAVSEDSSMHITEKYASKGKNLEAATQNVRNIAYNYKMSNDHLIFDDFIQSKTDSKKWRDQSVEVTLSVPEGTVLVFNKMDELVYRKPPMKNSWTNYEIPLESTPWKIEDGQMVALDSTVKTAVGYSDNLMKDITPSGSFTNIQAEGNIELEIIGGFEHKVLTSDPGNIMVSSSGNTLKFENRNGDFINVNSKPIKVKIIIRDLQDLQLSGVCSAELTGFAVGDLKADLSGSSTLIFNSIKLDRFDLEMSGLSTFEGLAEINSAFIDASGSSTIKGYDMDMDALNLDLSGASNADVLVRDEISGSVSGTSSLKYRGRPNVDVRSSGAAKVKSVK